MEFFWGENHTDKYQVEWFSRKFDICFRCPRCERKEKMRNEKECEWFHAVHMPRINSNCWPLVCVCVCCCCWSSSLRWNCACFIRNVSLSCLYRLIIFANIISTEVDWIEIYLLPSKEAFSLLSQTLSLCYRKHTNNQKGHYYPIGEFKIVRKIGKFN